MIAQVNQGQIAQVNQGRIVNLGRAAPEFVAPDLKARARGVV